MVFSIPKAVKTGWTTLLQFSMKILVYFGLGLEDLANLGDKDYQDMVVKVQAVPEPATMVISSLFLIGAGIYVRRKLHGKA